MINSNRNFKSRETGRRYRVENNSRTDASRKYVATLWDEKLERYDTAVNALGDIITGSTIAEVQRFVNAEDFWITTYKQWLTA